MKIFVFIAAILMSLCVAPCSNEAEAGRGHDRRMSRRHARHEARAVRHEVKQMHRAERGWRIYN